MASPAGAGAPCHGRGGWLLSPVGKRGSVSGARVVVGAAAAHESDDERHAHGETAAPALLPWWPPVLLITPM